MIKLAIIILADAHDAESTGRVFNGLISAAELVAAGHDVTVIFDGAGTIGAAKFSDPEDDHHEAYAAVKDRVVACSFCADAFGQKEILLKRSIKLVDESKGHPSFAKLLSQGYQVLSF